jgi:hypothetical protein
MASNFLAPSISRVLFIEENKISFGENARLDIFFVLGLDTFFLSFYD